MTFGEKTYAKIAATMRTNKPWPPPSSPWGAQLVALLEQAHKEELRETAPETPVKPAPVPRKRNELLDALVRLCGGDPENTTKSEFRTAATALSDIKGACPDLTVTELEARVECYKRKNKDWALTPPALAKWWSHLSPLGGAKTISESLNIYAEPAGWRSLLQRMYDLSDEGIRDKEWLDLGPDTRREILKRMRNSA